MKKGVFEEIGSRYDLNLFYELLRMTIFTADHEFLRTFMKINE